MIARVTFVGSVWITVAVVLAGIVAGRATAADHPRIDAHVSRAIAADPERNVAVWVHFTDRAGAERDSAAFATARERLTARALDRRAKRGTVTDLTAADLPVHEAYVRALVRRGARLRGTSRWLNAASVEIPARLAVELARLPFVARIAHVPVARRLRPVPEPLDGTGAGEAAPAEGGSSDRAFARTSVPGDTAYYGGSFRQLDMMQVPQLHALGLSGAGVLVCMLDSGFQTTHEVFTGLDIVATRDFIHGDLNVADEVGQDSPGQSDHGTWTLACVAGSKPDTYSGGAFAASVALGKTEDGDSETPVEMDYWQFGAEWADSLGADIISSSLGYSTFDNPGDSYTYADMDGKTTVVSLAAAEAARRGILVVNSAGNDGASPWFYIIAPADADSIVAVGAVDSFNVVASFSSHGPTSDGRIKPDVTAMGRRVLTVVRTVPTSYQRLNGTSFSCPLVTSLAALLFESHPDWTPVQMRDALRETALNHATPNNDIGWGLVQGLAANAWVPVAGTDPPAPPVAGGIELASAPNPLRSGTAATIRFTAPDGADVALHVVDVSGRRRANLYEGPSGTRTIEWRGLDANGRPLPAGIYWIRMTRAGAGSIGSLRVVVLP